jgi:hypothetical protein
MAFGSKAPGKYINTDTPVDVAVLGEEVVGNVKWDESEREYYSDPDGALRFGVNAWDGQRVRLLQGGWRLYKALTAAIKEHGPNTMYRIERSGSGTDTTYSAEFAREMPPEEVAKIAGAMKYDLAKEFPWAEVEASPPAVEPANEGDDSLPF